MKKIKFIIVTIISIFIISSCRVSNDDNLVITSFYAINSLTEELIKDTPIKTECLIKGATEPHDFEPSATQIAKMYDSKLIILNGFGMEEFSDSLLNNDNLNSKILIASKNNTPIVENNSNDPHTFVCVTEALTMVNTIKDSLIDTFSEYKDIINANYLSYYQELSNLDNQYEEFFKSYTNTLIVGHNAFSYLSRDYSVKTLSALGTNEEEPTAQGLIEIENYIKDNNISVIYGEYFEENDTISKIAFDTNSTVKYLYTGEMMDDTNLSYIQIMQKNLEAFKS